MDHLERREKWCPTKVKAVRVLNAELGEYYVTHYQESKRTKTVIGPADFVNTSDRQAGVISCQCGMYSVDGTPCVCMIAAQLHRKGDPANLYPTWCTAERWAAQYDVGGDYFRQAHIEEAQDELEEKRLVLEPLVLAVVAPRAAGRPKNHMRFTAPLRKQKYSAKDRDKYKRHAARERIVLGALPTDDGQTDDDEVPSSEPRTKAARVESNADDGPANDDQVGAFDMPSVLPPCFRRRSDRS